MFTISRNSLYQGSLYRGLSLFMLTFFRNFVRAPPSGVTFEFEYSNVSSVAMALLQEDPELEKMRYNTTISRIKISKNNIKSRIF